METVTYTCEYCGKTKTVSASYFHQIYPEGSKKPPACSRKCGCKLRYRGHATLVECPNCGKVNEKKLAQANRKFCNATCYAQYRRKHPELYPPGKLSAEALDRLKQRTGKNNPAYGMTGDKSPHWKGGREKYRGKGWHTIRKLIKRRDGNRCAICGKTLKQTSQLDVHHIFDWAETYCNHPHNLITLCVECHQAKLHGNEQAPQKSQLVALAQKSTLERLAADDLRCIVKLDLQQRQDRGLPAYIADALGLPKSYHGDWQQLRLC